MYVIGTNDNDLIEIRLTVVSLVGLRYLRYEGLE